MSFPFFILFCRLLAHHKILGGKKRKKARHSFKRELTKTANMDPV